MCTFCLFVNRQGDCRRFGRLGDLFAEDCNYVKIISPGSVGDTWEAKVAAELGSSTP